MGFCGRREWAIPTPIQIRKPASVSPSKKMYDVIVVGGGHAGTEAAAAAARIGARTALVTHAFATIGEMSCNPAIGGLGKGHLVREIDALGGLMGRVADTAGIQFRLLNRSQGPGRARPAHSGRPQVVSAGDAGRDSATINLDVIEGGVEDLIVEKGRVAGVLLGDGRVLPAGAVVLTTGTFLNGLIHMGEQKIPAGRAGEAPGAQAFRSALCAGFEARAPENRHAARLDGKSIDWSGLEMQKADDDPVPFSFLTERITTPQITCGITTTTAATHDIIRANLAPFAALFRADRKCRAALLPVDRRQSRALRRSRRRTRFSSNPRASTTTRSIRTASRHRCRPKFRMPSCSTIPGSSTS